MKERLFAILLAVALLLAAAPPVRPAIPFGAAVSVIAPDADCQSGGQCSR